MNSISRNTHLFNDFINSIYLNRDFIKVLDKYEYDLDGMDIYLWGVEKVNNDFKFTMTIETGKVLFKRDEDAVIVKVNKDLFYVITHSDSDIVDIVPYVENVPVNEGAPKFEKLIINQEKLFTALQDINILNYSIKVLNRQLKEQQKQLNKLDRLRRELIEED